MEHPQLIRLFIRQLLGWQFSGNPVLNISKTYCSFITHLRSASVFKLDTKVYIFVFMLNASLLFPFILDYKVPDRLFTCFGGVN